MPLLELQGQAGFGGRRVDDVPHLRNAVRGEASLARVFAHHLFVGRDVDAVDLVVGDVALQPLNLGPEVAQHRAGLLRDGL